jgi:hypothetical protein
MKGGMKMKRLNRKQERGNVLFLILIAVALFAALSYAVTQSSRSGGDASRETNILNAAQLTQYPTSVRTAILRLVIDGYQDTGLLFNNPASAVDAPNEVFSTIGGGAVYQFAPTEMMDTNGGNTAGRWFFNYEYEVPNIGRTPGDADVSGNELIAFLPEITESVCTRINIEANIMASTIDTIPVVTFDATSGGFVAPPGNGVGAYKNILTSGDVTPAGTVALDNTAGDLTGQPFGCFRDSNGSHVLYSVLLER